MAKIICARCQVEDEVPFEPSPDARILCESCHARVREEALKSKKEEADKKAPDKGPRKPPPRKKHGTRVFLPIECTACGKKETLDYVPKGGSLDEVLCSECALKKWGDKSRWADVARKKEKEQQTEFEFTCIDCGHIDILGTPPMKGRNYLCARCYYEHEEPQKERLEDREKVEKSVFIRKRKKD